MYLKQFDEARAELKKAISIHKNEQSFATLGRVFLMQGDVDGAIDVFRTAVE